MRWQVRELSNGLIRFGFVLVSFEFRCPLCSRVISSPLSLALSREGRGDAWINSLSEQTL